MRKPQAGFTIVELLIVVVVIAILATISIVAYNGIQTRATNAAIISSAQQTIKLLKAYSATYGKYPLTGGSYCLTTDSQCVSYNGTVVSTDNTTLLAELQKIGTQPANVPQASSSWYGITWDYYGLGRTYNHKVVPLLIMFNLKGTAQNCGLDNVVMTDPAPLPGENNPFISSTTGYYSTTSGITKCWVSVDI